MRSDLTTTIQVDRVLRQLVGLKLSLTRRAADMRIFQFGQITVDGPRSWAEWALHIQCPWRIESEEGLVTGSGELWHPGGGSGVSEPEETWNYDTDGNLQDMKIAGLFGSPVGKSGYALNVTNDLTVQSASGDRCGGISMVLSGGYRLSIFPTDGSSGQEAWRCLGFGADEATFVLIPSDMKR